MTRLSQAAALPPGVRTPAYDRAAHGEGIVHLGLGAFHRAHQAPYTEEALEAAGGDWRIVGVSLRSAAPAQALVPQDCLYTLAESGAEGTRLGVIGALSRALAFAHGDGAAVRAALASPSTRIVSLTVSEKGYGLDRATGGVDPGHPAIAHDLARPDAPVGVGGLLVRAIGERRAAGIAPFAVLSCDNLPGNGRLVRSLLLDFAARTAPDLVDVIAGEVAFPSSMVDRITPAPGPRVIAMVKAATGLYDAAAVEAEPFRQWVIEDAFPSGRPAWEAGGALLVSDVSAYERMKLRMLNGTHSMLAYAGHLSGRRTVRDVMADDALARLVRRHMAAAAATLAPLDGVDFAAYADDLSERFANPNIAHETCQIAMDGTEKLPQRIFAPALDTLDAGGDVSPFAFATAAWMRHALGRTDDGTAYPLRDPREEEIAARLSGARGAADVASALFSLPGLFPAALAADDSFRAAVGRTLAFMLEAGMAAAVRREVECVR